MSEKSPPLTLQQYADYARGDYREIERRYFEDLAAHAQFMAGYKPPPAPPWHTKLAWQIGTLLIRLGVWLGGEIDDCR